MSLNINNVQVDKDTVLFSDLIKFEINPTIHSPVILGKGATSTFLDHSEDFNYKQRVLDASKAFKAQHDLVIYEGTGHRDVAKRINASVIMVVKGGIGSTVDIL